MGGVAALGLLAGVMGGRLLGQALAGLLYGIGVGDPATIGAVTALLAVTTLAAMWLPARGAAVMDPMDVLRED
jgi:ABC-type antimicrobial peptide transport system permease subunit